MAYASLDDLIREQNALRPTSDGSGTGFAGANDYYQNYRKVLSDYGAAHSGDDDFDYTKFKIQSDYVTQQAKAANDAYQNYLLTEKNALGAKGTMANIKDQTLKYLAGQQQAQGLAGQGVAQSVQAGVGNQYAGNVMQIENERQEANNDTYQRYLEGEAAGQAAVAEQNYQYEQGNRENAYNLAVSLYENGVGIDKIMELYGDSLTKEQLDTLNALDEAGNREAGLGYISDVNGAVATDYVTEIEDIVNKLGNNPNMTKFLKETGMQELLDSIKAGTIKNGTVIRITAGKFSGGGISISNGGQYLVYVDGRLYPSSAEAYAQAKNKMH